MNTVEPEAAKLFQRTLEHVFELHEQGNYADAEPLYNELIKHSPSIWQLHFNYGLLLFEMGRLDEAEQAYRRGLAVDAENPDLWFNLGICCKNKAAYEDALMAYHKVLSLSPDDIDSLYNIAGCYRTMGNDEAAVDWYLRTLQVVPEHMSALTNLAFLYHKNDRPGDAAEVYRTILSIDPNHVRADYMLAAISGTDRQSAPDGYVRDLFDQFSDHYEENLVEKLEYRLPSALLKFMHRVVPGTSSFGRLLDLGCGTGLAGEALEPYCASMTGVDISKKMVEAARAKSIYTSLHVAELQTFLEQTDTRCCDSIVAADVLPYVGALKELFDLLAGVSTDRGVLCFSIEKLPDGEAPFKLQPSGRFAHTPSYVERVASETGWCPIASEEIALRREKDDWITGIIFGLRRSP